jgi:DNA-binding XRE family transcriptional regulator
MNRIAEIRRRLSLSPSALAGPAGIATAELLAIEAGEKDAGPELQARLVAVLNAAECGRYDQEDWTVQRVFGGEKIYG